APGVDIESAMPDGQMTTYSGTSMATPHVAGALAVLKAQSPDTPMPELIAKLVSTGRPYVYQAGGTEVRTPRLDLAAAVTGAAPQPDISQSPPAMPDPGPADPVPDPGPQPDPDPTSSGPTPEPDPPAPDPAPVPLPTVTVTVTVTVTPTPPAQAAPVCTRRTSGRRLTTRQWSTESHRRSAGRVSDELLTCYLKLVGKASKVCAELTKPSTLGTAYRVLKNTRTAKRRLDGVLLTGWLNWAHGRNGTKVLKSGEKVRLSKRSTSAALKKAATKVIKSQ